uniref:Notochord specific 8 protein n=1 Tax=Ciona intestinalis TaxID=7719 RepID=Q86SC6_CIOIN|nr:notochord specific gene 8 protein [Ciona intestinalis]BAC57523.1 notochord specific gene 8 protein [Ciona intestinalis]|eukprot:NP_001027629.1 notochord specific gene 8 protein [Ciona intestinalis]
MSQGNTSTNTELNLEYAASLILRVFQSYDVDNGGTLQRRELRNLLRQCGAKLSSKQCDDIIDQLDTDGDGEMNFAEFMAFLGRLYQLQFFGSDPGDFWKRTKEQDVQPAPKLPPRSSPHASPRTVAGRPLPAKPRV